MRAPSARPVLLLDRRDMTRKSAEAWRPPLIPPAGGVLQRYAARARLFLDIQNGSIWRDLKRVLPKVRGTVVDVGCGAQPYRSLFSEQATYIGIDTADAKAHFGYEMPDTRYFEGDRWPIDDSSADFILSTETMEHVPEPRLFLAEAARCLVPGGTLLITVPFAARWHFIPYDYWRYTPSGLQRLLTSAGFSEVHVYARGNAVTVACYKAIALLLRLVMPQNQGFVTGLILRLFGLLLLPVLLLFAVLANISLTGQGGDDCLGYTAVAVKCDL